MAVCENFDGRFSYSETDGVSGWPRYGAQDFANVGRESRSLHQLNWFVLTSHYDAQAFRSHHHRESSVMPRIMQLLKDCAGSFEHPDQPGEEPVKQPAEEVATRVQSMDQARAEQEKQAKIAQNLPADAKTAPTPLHKMKPKEDDTSTYLLLGAGGIAIALYLMNQT